MSWGHHIWIMKSVYSYRDFLENFGKVPHQQYPLPSKLGCFSSFKSVRCARSENSIPCIHWNLSLVVIEDNCQDHRACKNLFHSYQRWVKILKPRKTNKVLLNSTNGFWLSSCLLQCWSSWGWSRGVLSGARKPEVRCSYCSTMMWFYYINLLKPPRETAAREQGQYIQLFWERLSEKVHATILCGWF